VRVQNLPSRICPLVFRDSCVSRFVIQIRGEFVCVLFLVARICPWPLLDILRHRTDACLPRGKANGSTRPSVIEDF